MPRRYWLMKSEPSVFSWDDLWAAKGRTTFWDGVRNYQARNLLRDEIQVGDLVLFYHSSTDPQAILGVAEVVEAGSPDPTQFEPKSDHYDGESSPDDPRWYGVKLKAIEPLARPVTLAEMRQLPALKGMVLLKKGSRLSVQPVTADEYSAILKAAKGRAPSK